ncbi:hypothetical protein EJB05_40531, partial [Eragrostis curvula]
MSPFCYLAIFTLALASAAAGDGSYVAGPPKFVTPRQLFLEAHNAARAAAGVPPLSWNATLALDAQRYLNELHSRCNTRPLVAWGTDGVYGRNLFKGHGMGSGADEAVASWVGEGRWYDNRGGECTAPEGETCVHYTQVVWRATTQVGCRRRLCSRGEDTVAVCEYYPPGNVKGQRPY